MESFCICWYFYENTVYGFHWLLKEIYDLKTLGTITPQKDLQDIALVTTMFSLSLAKHSHMVFPPKAM